ncbi:Transporter associated domain protein [compost metagenome]
MIIELNARLGLDIIDENVDSIGGWLYSKQSELKIDEQWEYQDWTFIVRERDVNRIRKIELLKN